MTDPSRLWDREVRPFLSPHVRAQIADEPWQIAAYFKLRAQIFAEGNLVLQAVLRGHGVALVDRFLAAEDIAAGRLVQPFDLSIRHGAYWLVARSFKRLSPEAKAFRTWLLQRLDVGKGGV